MANRHVEIAKYIIVNVKNGKKLFYIDGHRLRCDYHPEYPTHQFDMEEEIFWMNGDRTWEYTPYCADIENEMI